MNKGNTMTHYEALTKLIETRTLTTAMLKPFKISFDEFLRADHKHPDWDQAVDALIKREQDRAKINLIIRLKERDKKRRSS